jgi:flagellar assembly protein FliH
MAVLKQSTSRAAIALGGVFDLVDLRVGAERALAEARAEAARIVEEAKREGDRLRADARREGVAAGEAEGRAKGLEEGRRKGEAEGHAAAKAEHDAAFRAIEEGFANEFGAWIGARDDVMRAAERDLAGIAVAIAEGIVREHVQINRDVVVREVQAAITLFARATRVTVETAPEDLEIVRHAMPTLAEALPQGAIVQIVAREGMERGGCVIRSSEGAIDARLETQFRRMREGLVGIEHARATEAAIAEAAQEIESSGARAVDDLHAESDAASSEAADDAQDDAQDDTQDDTQEGAES